MLMFSKSREVRPGQLYFLEAVCANHLSTIAEQVMPDFVNARDSVFGRSLLHAATTAEMVSILHQKGAELNVQDLCRQTPLHVAAMAGNYFVVAQLLALGADSELLDQGNMTALDWALRCKSRQAAQYRPIVAILEHYQQTVPQMSPRA